MFLVAGGVSSQPGSEGRQTTTEVLVEGGTEWRLVGELPTPLGGMSGATLGNKAYIIGRILKTYWIIEI